MSRKEQEVMREMKRRWANRCSEGELFCFLCGQQIKNMKDCNADHWVPRALGGKTTEENLKPAHKSCNSKKGCMSPDEFIAHREEVLSRKYKPRSNKERIHEKDKKKTPKINRKERKRQKKQERLLYKASYKLQQPYDIGTTVFYVKELPSKDNKPRFEVKQGVVIGYSYKAGIEYALVKDFYVGKDNKIKSELLDVIPLTKTQAIATKIEYEKLIKHLVAKQNGLSY